MPQRHQPHTSRWGRILRCEKCLFEVCVCVRACGLARMRVRACARVLLPVCEYGCACVCVCAHVRFCYMATAPNHKPSKPNVHESEFNQITFAHGCAWKNFGYAWLKSRRSAAILLWVLIFKPHLNHYGALIINSSMLMEPRRVWILRERLFHL